MHRAADAGETAAAEAAHEIDILHQRQRRKPADRVVERAGDQQALVAIGQRQHAAAPGDDALEPPRRAARVVQREVEIAGAAGRVRARR